MTTTHGTTPRGLDATRSPLFEGRFGRMFRNLSPASFGADDLASAANLAALGEAMSAPPDPAKDGPDAEESGIPALYTYFGQFVDHDITFDPVSSLTKSLDPDGLTDYRTPSFNLDNVYGRGPDDQPYMYDGNKHFALGDPITGTGGRAGDDLPRFNDRALIGDPRNDENSLVSQLQGLFLRIHNRMMDENGNDFEAVQQLVRFHYQYVVVNDFLSRIVKASVLDSLKVNGRYAKGQLRFYHWRNAPFMPVEFSVAAYRLGHSMIRPGYRLNDDKLLPIFPPPNTNDEALTGFGKLGSGRALDWGRFIDVDQRPGGTQDGTDNATKKRLQFAYRIDTSLVGPLHDLPASIARNPSALGARNLLRGWRLGLPSGQSVARAMGIRPMKDKDIIIGKAVDTPAAGDVVGPIVDAVTAKGGDGALFADNCPLWTYILAEAAVNKLAVKVPVTGNHKVKTPQLGDVGGRIVAEVFLGMLFGDGSSYLSLDPLWHPVTGADFHLKDLVAYGLGDGPSLHYH
jgi:hypothetical protein